MTDQTERAEAMAEMLYESLCNTLDCYGWNYDRNDEARAICCGVQGDDIPIELTMYIDAQRELIRLVSHIPAFVPEDKRIDLAVAVSIANNKLVDGCFDLDLNTGDIFFHMAATFRDSVIGDEVFAYMLICAEQTIDVYNDRFLMLAKGLLSLEQFVAAEHEEQEA